MAFPTELFRCKCKYSGESLLEKSSDCLTRGLFSFLHQVKILHLSFYLYDPKPFLE